jgi:DHA3 family tetracycline resistance protein-like MFS transporter
VKRLPPYQVYLLMEGGTAVLMSMIFTASSIYQVSVANLTPLQLVLVGTTLELAVLLFEVPTGVVADVYSRRLSIWIGMFLIGFGFILEGSVPLFGTILLAQLLWGLGYTFTSGATQAWITDEIGETAAGQAFLRSNQVGQFGALAGIGAGALLGSVAINIPIIAGGGLIILLGIFLVFTMPETGFIPTPREERSTWQNMMHTFRQGVGMVKNRPALRTILGIGLFYGLYSEGFDRLWTKHMLDDVGFPIIGGLQPVVWIGLMRAGGMLLSVVAVELVRRRVQTDSHQSLVSVLFWITLGLIAGLISFALVPGFGLALLAYWLIYICRSLIDPLYTAWVNQRLDSSVRATVISMSGQVDAIGQIASGPLVGLIGNLFSVQTAISLTGFILAPILALFARAKRLEPEPAVEVPDLVVDS